MLMTLQAKIVKLLLKYLEFASKELFRWFDENSMKANADKSNFLISSKTQFETKVGDTSIKNSNQQSY